MALTAAERAEIRNRLVTIMRKKGYHKGRVKYKTGTDVSDITGLAGGGSNIFKDYGQAGLHYAKWWTKKFKESGSAGTVYKKSVELGHKEGHKKDKTGKSDMTGDTTVKKSGYSNKGEINTWASTRLSQYRAMAKAGKLTNKQLKEKINNVNKRKNKLLNDLA
jgi:hypothetical protein